MAVGLSATEARQDDARGWEPTAPPPLSGSYAPDGPASRGAGWPAAIGGALRARCGRVRSADVVGFVRNMATLLNAGLPLPKCLRTMARQLEKPRMAQLVGRMANDVSSGELFSSAMALAPEAFDSLTISAVRAGEAGGTLPETLQKLADDMEKKQALRRTVVGAMAYPAIVVVIALGVVSFLLVYVVPAFEDVYVKMHLTLPWITRALLWASRTALACWWAPAVLLAAAVVGWRPLQAVEGFRRRWDRLLLELPLLGKLRRKAISTRFLGAFATLIGSGVSIVESLRLMTDLVDNTVVRDAIADIRRHVTRGGKISEPMERYAGLFSPMAIQMISVGEETGELPEAAAHTARFLAEEVETRVKTLTMLMEPALTVGLGVVVGAIALAIYLPMFDLMQSVSR